MTSPQPPHPALTAAPPTQPNVGGGDASNLSAATHKGYPAWAPPLPLSAVGQQGWHVLQPNWPLPCAVIRQAELQHNLGWMQRLVARAGVELAPHGKTTLSPELFQAQLAAGAWGITFAQVSQLAMGVAHGVRRALVANQVLLPHDLHWLDRLYREHPDLYAPFWVDSTEQLQAIEAFAAHNPPKAPWPVLLELGLEGGRTGCRTHDQALALACALRASPSTRLVGLACYEGLWTSGDTAQDSTMVERLMRRVHAVAQQCDAEGLFNEAPEVIITAGGSAVFDLVLPWLRPALQRPVRALLRSGCYVTHDDGHYQRLVHQVDRRLGLSTSAGKGCGGGLQAALEVWTVVQSCPEPGLAILNAGKRDLSHDLGLPTPVRWAPVGHHLPLTCPDGWTLSGLNDQHAYLRVPTAQPAGPTLAIGDRVALGISHPCTTFDKWRWMPLIGDRGDVVGAISTRF